MGYAVSNQEFILTELWISERAQTDAVEMDTEGGRNYDSTVIGPVAMNYHLRQSLHC